MGADGHIQIWRADKVRQEWPDADALFYEISTHYKHELGGVEYDHCYYGDNLYSMWDSAEQLRHVAPEKRERVSKFMDWLNENTDAHWEVWT